MKRILLLLFCFYHYYSNAIIAPALTFGLNKGVSGGTMGITPGNQGAVVIDASGNSYVGFASDRGLTFNAAVTFPAVSVVIPVTVVGVAVAVSIAITAVASTTVGTAAGTVGAGVGASAAASASLTAGAGHPFSHETSPLITRQSTTPPPHSSDGIELSNKKQQNLFDPTPSLV